VKLEFVQQVSLVLQLVQVSQLVQVLLLVQPVQVFARQVLPQPLVLVVFHRVALLQLVHLMKKSKKKMNQNYLGYKF
jgi:hypothetical protein